MRLAIMGYIFNKNYIAVYLDDFPGSQSITEQHTHLDKIDSSLSLGVGGVGSTNVQHTR